MKDSSETKVVKITKKRKVKKIQHEKSSKDTQLSETANGDANVYDGMNEGDIDHEASAPKIVKEVAVQPRRDFSTDLMGYISSWNYRETSGLWKFNKILQTWALDNCYDKKRIDATLFKSLMPYLLSIKGNAVDRLLVRAEEIITQSCENDEENEDDDDDDKGADSKKGKVTDESSSLSLKRAIKIKFEFSKLTKLPPK